ncbi:phosphatidate cytidylyltransferase [Labilibaculum manganireducens]|uniref:phosphatidate cytidylyltransferase n=1 Tax=Labilibaculum manganireducens TaxID=1940525 RepID=UPI0015D5B540|nr:phosphatidate cytidylyltransferase [Labilibaculum manganireducens]
MGNFIKRTLSAAIFAIVLIAGITLHPIGFLVVFLGITLLGTFEFYKLAKKANSTPQCYTGMFAAGILFLACFANTYLNNSGIFLLFAVTVVMIPIIELYRKKENPFVNIAFTLLGLLYVALPFSLLNYMVFPFNSHQFHYEIILGVFVMIWANDTGAYLVGVNFGKHRLFERISPKKSWEGSIGGAIITLGIAWLYSNYSNDLTLIQWLVTGVIVVVFGSIGDLVESLFKRSINIKDSGNILPGHGGILDRFDAILLVSPMVFVFLQTIKEFFH